ncbi:hypothetical protein Ae201684P_010665 [Aphanomyces euteiches]|nr:hypothetical protein Ae201684P_010665 [Aphanomyces euteiches]
MVYTDKRRKDAREGMAKATSSDVAVCICPPRPGQTILCFELSSKGYQEVQSIVCELGDSSAGYEEIQVPTDASSRRSGFNWLANKAYNMSVEAQPSSPIERKVEDAIKVKLHVGEDDIGTSIRAIECHVQLTIDANFENAAKTWWFDLVESTPMLSSTVSRLLSQQVALNRRYGQ